MTTFTRGARVGALVISVVLLLLVPGIAAAKFSGSRAAPINVSTATMVAASGVAGTYACTTGLTTETITVSSPISPTPDPTGAQYVFTLSVAGTVKQTVVSSTRSANLAGSQTRDLASSRPRGTIDIQASSAGGRARSTTVTAVCSRGQQGTGNL